MAAPSSEPKSCFGVYEVDRRAGELRKSGIRIRIPEQPFRILTALLDRPGEVVTREELRQILWLGDTFVDFDHSLNAAVNKLRELLGDSASRPRFVETIPRRGYRFIYPVTVDPAVRTPGPDQAPAPEWAGRPRRRWLFVGGASLAAIVLVAMLFDKLGGLVHNDAGPQLAAVPLTSVPGLEMSPTFSPDGNQVAYSWNGPREDNFDIYIKMVGGAEPFRLTDDPASDFGPAWSPDGRSVAFLRQIEKAASLRIVSPLGGRERDLGEIGAQHVPGNDALGRYMAWTPDGNWLAVQDQKSPAEPSCLWLLSPQSGKRRKLTDPEPGIFGDYNPAFSPDGGSVVFVRISSTGFTLFLLDLDEDYSPTGKPRPLVSDRRQKYAPVFSADGKRLIYGSGEWSDPSLWEVDIAGALPPRRLPFVGDGGNAPAVSPQANRLSYTRTTREWNIWKIVRNGPGQYSEPVKVIPSTRFEKDPKFSPDASRITFTSTRSGYPEIWIANSDGSGLQQLTFFEGPGGGSPRWSPDGESIAFDSLAAGNMDVYVIASGGGTPRRLTDDPAADHRPSWSHDGKWIYFASIRSGENQVWKVPAEGGEAQQLTRGGGWDPLESPDRAFVYYVRQDGTLWTIPVEGGEESQFCDSCRVHSGHSTLSVVEGGLYFLDPRPEADGRYAVRYLDLASGQLEPVARFGQISGIGLGASPDGRAIVYSNLDQERADIMLVESFR